MSETSGGRHHPGAARVSFFEEQARRRTQARAWGIVTAAVAWLLGWILGFLLLTAALFYILLIRSFLPRPLGDLVTRLAPNGDAVFVPLALGGLLFAGLLWGFIRWTFDRDTTSAFLPRLNARPPNPENPEEKQVVNVAEEMAIAASAPMPTVRLFDGAVINAAVLGPDARQFTLLLSRRLLDTLDRDETQGVVAHLTASAINGDLVLSNGMIRLFHVLGLAVTILDLPFSKRARSALGDLLRFVGRSQESTLGDGEQVAARLTESLQPDGLEAMNRFLQRALEPESSNPVRKVVGALLLMPLLPLIMIRLGAALLYGMLSLFVLGPPVALLLRSRRRLADATAVQLTRHPDGLACALVHLVAEAHTVSQAEWAEMLFIVGPEAAQDRETARLESRMAAIRASSLTWKAKARAGLAAASETTSDTPPPSAANRHNFIFGFHPSLNSRIAQLKRMGATKVKWEVRVDRSGLIIAIVAALVIGAVAILAVAGSRN